jgi:hypothetical protein
MNPPLKAEGRKQKAEMVSCLLLVYRSASTVLFFFLLSDF